MEYIDNTLQQISESWFLTEPAFFALYCLQQLTENPRMDCPVRCGQGRLEYNPLLLAHRNYHDIEQLIRIELIRLFLKHPYERQPEGCSLEAMSIGSNITIADGYCCLHHDKLPLHDPAYYHLPLGQYYEWYAKAIQQQNPSNPGSQPSTDSDRNQTSTGQGNNGQQSQPQASPSDADADTADSGASPSGSQSHAALWQDDSLQRQRINDLIERTNDWGTLPGEIVERIKASTRARIDNRLIWQGFSSAVLSSQRHLTRMKPNRRTGFLQMGSRREFDTQLLVAIDVSGSITSDMLDRFFSSVNRLFRYGVAQIHLCQFDVQMGPVEPMTRIRPKITVQGRGGTDFMPVFAYIDQHVHDYDGVIILTDGQAPIPSQKPRIPLLWVCSDQTAYDTCHESMANTGRCCVLL